MKKHNAATSKEATAEKPREISASEMDLVIGGAATVQKGGGGGGGKGGGSSGTALFSFSAS